MRDETEVDDSRSVMVKDFYESNFEVINIDNVAFKVLNSAGY
jgi:hypothetical protein